MDTMKAIVLGEANRGKEPKVFDWDKAAKILRERGATNASAGLAQDWEWTGGYILRGGVPDLDSYTYLASTWATPVLELEDGDTTTIECWKMQSEVPDWSSDTRWPESAMAIFKGD